MDVMERLELVAYLDPMDHADLQDFQDFPELKDIVVSEDLQVKMETLELLERKVTLDLLVLPVPPAHKVFVDPMESADVMDLLDLQVFAEMTDNLVLPDQLDPLDLPDLLASPVSLALREMLDLLDPVVLKVLPVDVVRMDFQDPQVQVETQVFLERPVLLVQKVIAEL